MSPAEGGETRDGVPLTNLDQPLFDEASATKRDLVDYLDAVSERILPGLADRPLSVIRVHRGSDAFMQKNVPTYTPDWVQTVSFWAETSKRDVRYALCNDRRTLLWFANQRAVEYHPALVHAEEGSTMTHLVLDLDPPEGADFSAVVATAHLVRQALENVEPGWRPQDQRGQGAARVRPHRRGHLDGRRRCRHSRHRRTRRRPRPRPRHHRVREGGAGGKVFVDATRVGAATVIAAYSPRVRPGVPVSFPLAWDELAEVTPAELTIHTALDRLGDRDPWAEHMPAPQALPADLVAEGAEIPVGRVAAMHEGKRRARAKRSAG